MNKKFISAISGAAALALAISGSAFAAQKIAITLNTDLKLTRQSTVTIIDQQSPILDGNGNPVIDTNGNEETEDVTSVNLDLFYTYGDFKADLLDGIANQGILDIGVEPAGFCASLSPGGGMGPQNETRPFEIPLGQLRKGPSLPPLLTNYIFQGLTGPQFIMISRQALAEALAPAVGAPAPQPIPPADSQGGFNGVPYANMTLSLSFLNAGELKLDGIIDLRELLGVPQGKVDLVVTYGESEPDSDNANSSTLEGACLPNVTPAVTIVPVGFQPQQILIPQ
jgi:hypothetical protein